MNIQPEEINMRFINAFDVLDTLSDIDIVAHEEGIFQQLTYEFFINV